MSLNLNTSHLKIRTIEEDYFTTGFVKKVLCILFSLSIKKQYYVINKIRDKHSALVGIRSGFNINF